MDYFEQTSSLFNREVRPASRPKIPVFKEDDPTHPFCRGDATAEVRSFLWPFGHPAGARTRP